MKKFTHFEIYSTTLNVVYIVTQLSLFTFVIDTILKTF
jgi:preprotein translocase subunit SecE